MYEFSSLLQAKGPFDSGADLMSTVSSFHRLRHPLKIPNIQMSAEDIGRTLKEKMIRD